MPNSYLLAAAALMIGIALGVSAAKLLDYRRRLRAVESELAGLRRPCSKHGLTYLVRHDVAESALFGFVSVRDEFEIAQKRLDFCIRQAQHVANGGKPDDPPTLWKE